MVSERALLVYRRALHILYITVKAFLEDRCIMDLQAPDYITQSGKVYEEYQEYCKQRKERPTVNNLR